ncbi:MAG TPA: hypothetical protein DEP84_27690 [Chloroflexi bacterium]|nr:hypothetical protein [Chloroflexota bacterium]
MIVVPEVEPLVSPFRLKHDPSAALGVPAHITINYPFIPAVQPGVDLHRELSGLFAETDAFPFRLDRLARFPDVLYLPPIPDAPFKRLIQKVASCFPESPPYGGAFENVIPHLPIAQTRDQALLASIERQLSQRSSEYLSISARAERIWLMDNRSGRWQKRASFPLRSK